MARKSIWAIAQDPQGFMWMGTTNGLHRYDGKQLTIFKSEVRDTSSLPNLNIRTFTIDDDGTFWICTQGGALSKYIPEKQAFFNVNPAKSLEGSDVPLVFDFWSITSGSNKMLWLASFSGDGFYGFDRKTHVFKRFMLPSTTDKHFSHVTYVVESSVHQLWVGTMESGIAQLDLSGNIIRRFVHNPADPTSIGSNKVQTLFEDKEGTIWAGMEDKGLWYYDPKATHFKPAAAFQRLNSPEAQRVFAILQDEWGLFWIGSNDGVFIYNAKTDTIVDHFKHNPAQAKGLSSNHIRSLFRDRGGVYWIGTEGGGVHKAVQRKPFTAIHSGLEPGMLNADIVRTFLQVDSQHVWVGTQGGGINVFDTQQNRVVKTIRANSNSKNALSEDRISTLMHDPKGGIWVGTWGGGLNFVEPDLKRIKTFRFDENNPESISDDRIQLTYIDKKQRFWVGTENGLNLFNRESGTFRRLKHDSAEPGTLSGNTIQTLAFSEDSADIFWVGTWQGFNKYDAGTNTAKRFVFSNTNANSLSSDHVTSVLDTKDGNLWIGTFGGGLNRFHKKSESFELFTERNGLPHNLVFSVLPDKNGFLWLSTSAGLSRFDPKTRQFVNFYEEDGLQGNDFWWGAAYIAPDGRFFFGGTNGFTTFYPDSILSNDFQPPVAFSSVKALDRAVLPDSTGTIYLTYNNNSITVEFAAFDFSDPVKNQYAYRLEGVDSDWIYSGNRNSVSYAALKGGKYVLKIRGSNNDGKWNDTPAQLTIIVNPPFWDTTWFKISAVFGMLALVVMYFMRRNRIIQKQRRLLSEEVDRRTHEIESQKETILRSSEELARKNEALLELNEEKNYLISVVAHDLRNPLGSLRGYAEYLRDEDSVPEPEKRRVLQLMANAAQHGLDLISRILDVEVMEHRKLDLKLEEMEGNEFVSGLAKTFAVQAAAKRMRLEIQPSRKPANFKADSQYLTQIVENLVSNAIKYAPEGTRIFLSIENDMETVRFSVRDEGPGIDETDQAKLFRKFQRLKAKPTAGEHSVGLGLSIVKRFTEAMSGKVGCESKLGQGATFWVEFPVLRK